MASLSETSAFEDWDDSRIEQVPFRSAITILDRDVVLLRLHHLQFDYSLSEKYLGAELVSANDSPRIDADVMRRQREMKMLLERGGTLVVFLHAPDHWYVDTGERAHSGTGRNARTTRIVQRRDLSSVLPFQLSTEAAKTRELELLAGDAFAAFWKAIDGKMESAAFMTKTIGEATLKIRGTDCFVGGIAKFGSGAVIVLPQDPVFDEVQPRKAARNSKSITPRSRGAKPLTPVSFLDALTVLIRELRSDRGEFALPEWASSVIIPGEAAFIKRLRVAETNVRSALKEADTAKSALQLLQRRKILLTGTGKAFEDVVEEALTALGFDVQPGAPNRTDRVARHSKFGSAVIEAKGRTKSAAEKDCAQLEKWVSEHHIAFDEKAKGILIVNAWRDVPLAERIEHAFPNQMLAYASARQHCLVTGTQLLCAWQEAESKPERAVEIAKELFETNGRYKSYEEPSAWITADGINGAIALENP